MEKRVRESRAQDGPVLPLRRGSLLDGSHWIGSLDAPPSAAREPEKRGGAPSFT